MWHRLTLRLSHYTMSDIGDTTFSLGIDTPRSYAAGGVMNPSFSMKKRHMLIANCMFSHVAVCFDGFLYISVPLPTCENLN